MKSVKSFLALAILFSLLLTACKGADGPMGPAGSSSELSGDIIGYIKVYDMFGVPKSDYSGVNVLIDGTNYSTTTDSKGRYVLSNVKAGTYNISFSKTGFGTKKVIGYSFSGNGQSFVGNAGANSSALYLYLCEIPSYKVIGLSAVSTGGAITVRGSFSGTVLSGKKSCVLFISKTPTVSSNPRDYIQSENEIEDISTTFSTYLYLSDEFKSGQTIYIIGYANAGSYMTYFSSYVDIATGNLVYPSLNPTPSNVVSVVVP